MNPCLICSSYYIKNNYCFNCQYRFLNRVESSCDVKSLRTFHLKYQLGEVNYCPDEIKNILCDLRAFNLIEILVVDRLLCWNDFKNVGNRVVRDFAIDKYIDTCSNEAVRRKLKKYMLSDI